MKSKLRHDGRCGKQKSRSCFLGGATFPLQCDSVAPAQVSVTTMSPARCRRSDDVVTDLRRPFGLPSPSVTKGGARAARNMVRSTGQRGQASARGWQSAEPLQSAQTLHSGTYLAALVPDCGCV